MIFLKPSAELDVWEKASGYDAPQLYIIIIRQRIILDEAQQIRNRYETNTLTFSPRNTRCVSFMEHPWRLTRTLVTNVRPLCKLLNCYSPRLMRLRPEESHRSLRFYEIPS